MTYRWWVILSMVDVAHNEMLYLPVSVDWSWRDCWPYDGILSQITHIIYQNSIWFSPVVIIYSLITDLKQKDNFTFSPTTIMKTWCFLRTLFLPPHHPREACGTWQRSLWSRRLPSPDTHAMIKWLRRLRSSQKRFYFACATIRIYIPCPNPFLNKFQGCNVLVISYRKKTAAKLSIRAFIPCVIIVMVLTNTR